MKKSLIVLLVAVFMTAVGYGEADASKPAKKPKTAVKAKKAKKQQAPSAEAVPAAAPKTAEVAPALAPVAAPAAPTGSQPGDTTATTSSATTTTTTVAAPSDAAIIGEVELRPTWTSKSGEFHTENSAELGYKFDKQLSVSYLQMFNSNIYEPSAKSDTKGLGLYAFDGFARVKVKDIWQSGDLHFSYEARAYMPTWSNNRDHGMITIVRNYAKLKYDATKFFSVQLSEVPIVHLYNKSGLEEGAKMVANPIFENRVYLIPHVDITSKLSFELPIMFHQTRYRDFSTAANYNDSWKLYLWTYPELNYEINANLNVGVAYYSDGLVTTDPTAGGTSSSFKDGLEAGVTQVFLRANL